MFTYELYVHTNLAYSLTLLSRQKHCYPIEMLGMECLFMCAQYIHEISHILLITSLEFCFSSYHRYKFLI